MLLIKVCLQPLMRSKRAMTLILLMAVVAFPDSGFSAETRLMEAGFGIVDITPDLTSDRPVWLAGYGQNRRATGVHDPIFSRAVVFKDGQTKIAMVVADVVGLFYPTVLNIRERLPNFDYVLVHASTDCL
jgi:hypothetical protein